MLSSGHRDPRRDPGLPYQAVCYSPGARLGIGQVRSTSNLHKKVSEIRLSEPTHSGSYRTIDSELRRREGPDATFRTGSPEYCPAEFRTTTTFPRLLKQSARVSSPVRRRPRHAARPPD